MVSMNNIIYIIIINELSMKRFWPKALQRRVKLYEGRGDGWTVQADVMGRRHGYQALHPGEGDGAVLAGADQAAADPVLTAVLPRRGKHAVGPEALHRRGHAACGGRAQQQGALSQVHCHRNPSLNKRAQGKTARALSRGSISYHRTQGMIRSVIIRALSQGSML